MNKKVIGIIIAVIALAGGFWYLTKPAPKTESTATKPTSHVEGAGTTGVTLLEYGDYQCPACGAYYPVVKQVVANYGDKIKFQFSNFPLETLHKNARAAARAAEAANLQGKFWEMHDKIYTSQADWSEASDPLAFFKTYAKSVGVANLTKFETDYKSSAVNDIINADIAEGKKIPVQGTPTFILNGKQIQSPTSIDGFNAAIDAAISSQAANAKK